jgi:hypothetical protein
MMGGRCTRAGRIVYDRKKHAYRGTDLLRAAFSLQTEDPADAQAAAFAIAILSAKVGEHVFGSGSGIEVLVNPRIILNQMAAGAAADWATRIQQNNPLRATELGIILEAWRSTIAIQDIERSKEEIVEEIIEEE